MSPLQGLSLWGLQRGLLFQIYRLKHPRLFHSLKNDKMICSYSTPPSDLFRFHWMLCPSDCLDPRFYPSHGRPQKWRVLPRFKKIRYSRNPFNYSSSTIDELVTFHVYWEYEVTNPPLLLIIWKWRLLECKHCSLAPKIVHPNVIIFDRFESPIRLKGALLQLIPYTGNKGVDGEWK